MSAIRTDPERSVDWFDALVGYVAVGRVWSLIYWHWESVFRQGPQLLGPYVDHACDAIVPLFWYVVLRRRFPIGKLRWNEMRGWRGYWLAAVIVMLATFATALALGLGSQLPNIMDISPAGFLFEITAPAIGEEFLWRGLIQTGLNYTITPRISVFGFEAGIGTLITAVLFGAAHMGNAAVQPYQVTCVQAISAFASGLVLGIGYERTRNLWGAIVAHAIANATLFGCIALIR